MTTSVKHAKVSIIPDSADTNDVRMSDWNDEHNVSITAADVGAATTGALAAHEADATAIHGITDTANLETTSGSQAKVDTHAAAGDPHPTYLTAAEGGAAYEASGVVAAHAAAADPHTGYLKESNTIDFLVGTTASELGGEIVVGATPGGELGNTWASPTVDASHSGSTHAATQAAAEATAASAASTHAAASDPHTGYRLESATIGTSDITDAAVTLAKQANLANSTIIGRITAGAGVPEALTGSQVKTILAIAASDVSGLAAFDATVPAAIGTAAVGSATSVPHRDHVHATGAGTPSTQAFSDAAATGSGPAASMTDHKHAWPALGTTAAAVGTSAGGSAATPSKSDHVHATGAGTPSTQAFADAAATGSGPAAAMTDHKHAMPSLATNTITLGSSVVAGSATTAARSDAGIAAFDTTAPTTIASGDTAATGSVNFASRRDHTHGMLNIAQFVVVASSVTHAQASTTQTNVTGLTFNIGASATEVWFVECFLEVSSGNNTMDVRFGWTFPTSCTMRWGAFGAGAVAGYSGQATTTTATAMKVQTDLQAIGTGAGTTIQGIALAGKVYGGGTSGAMQLTFAQDTSTAADLIVLAGSHMRYTKLVA